MNPTDSVFLLASAGTGFAFAYGMTSARDGPLVGRRGEDNLVERLSKAMGRLPIVSRLRRRSTIAQRRTSCLKEMPLLLDVVTLGLMAGLSFDSSLELYYERCEGGLADAFREAALTWRMGASTRDEALLGLADELGVAALERFAGVVSQALAFGSPLAATLERQAQTIREEQRSQMEEEIERVPVKMLIPLGTLIVPAMLLAILGPLLGPSIQMA